MSTSKKAKSTEHKQIEKRWTKPLVETGFTAIPNIILDKQRALGLNAMDVNIILQIAKHWWDAESAPFPSIGKLAITLGVTNRTVQKHISEMEKRKLIERTERFYSQGGQQSNSYTFNGLIQKCKPFAEEEIKARRKKKLSEDARLRRGTPMEGTD